MKTIKNILVIIVMLLCTLLAKAQEHEGDTVFLSAGLDPAIASGSNLLADGDRVGAGKLNYMLQFGIENFTHGKLGHKLGFQFEQFKNIHYLSGGLFGGITFSAPKIPFTNRTLGHFWYITGEINLISRKGIEDTRIYNPNPNIDWCLGVNLGVKIKKPNLYFFKLPFDVEIITNLKDRQDIRTHYGSTSFKDTVKVSVYLMFVYTFKK